MTTAAVETETKNPKVLRFLADQYEQSQRVRIETGERIRAVLQGRDETWGTNGEWLEQDPDVVLRNIKDGDTVGPVAILGRTYRRYALEEDEMRKEMMLVLQHHPAWPWLKKVKGIGPTLACKILARLDPELAPHVSSFWAYCGLATVPGVMYRCPECGLERTFPQSYNVTGKHKEKKTGGAVEDGGNEDAFGEMKGKNCPSLLQRVAGPEDGIRAAQPKPARGSKAPYDQYAKKIMYLIGTSFLKAGGRYEQVYRTERAKLERERPGWADGRKHLTALRKVEKLFLSHLWEVWRKAIDLPVTTTYAEGILNHEGHIDPWEMVEPEGGEGQ